MPYREILVELIDPNPFQTRKEFDMEVLTGIALSSMDELGIRNAPLVRPNPNNKDRFQIGSGHGRVESTKLSGKKKLICRVEDLTDAQMKKEVLVENVNRSDLGEEERMVALEQYREELGLEVDESGFISKLSQATGIPETTLKDSYLVKEVRNRLKIVDVDELKRTLILRTRGLKENEQDKLILKSLDRGWSSDTAFKVKTAIKDMDENVRLTILDEETDLTWKTIQKLTDIKDPQAQLETIKYIQEHKLNEELALKIVERVSKGEIPKTTTIINEQEEIMDRIRGVALVVEGWGFNHFMILGEHRWQEACEVFTAIEDKMRWLKTRGWEK